MVLVLLPLLLYSIHLALTGDMILFFLIVASAFIALLPRLLSAKVSKVEKSPEVLEPGIFTLDNQPFVLPPASITQDISLVADFETGRRFLRMLLADSGEEVWCLDSFDIDCQKSISLSSSSSEADIAQLSARSKISLPFSLILKSTTWPRLSKLPWIQNRSFRVIALGEPVPGCKSQITLEIREDHVQAIGNVGGEQVHLIYREDLLTSEPADDLGNQRASTGRSLDLVSQAGSKHGTSGGDEPKWFNFPIGRAVVDKTQTGFETRVAKNQVSEGLAGEMRGADTISDVASRLRQLGHGI